MRRKPFRGSYAPTDVDFLLQPVQMPSTPVDEKERLIQSGARHYSEMLSTEVAPTAQYLKLFRQAMTSNGQRLARDLLSLTLALEERFPSGVVLASLARAGTPIGVLLKRLLVRRGLSVFHYSISIIRDRGIDVLALDYIRERHPDVPIVFVDGWTGKGAISRQLETAILDYNKTRCVALDPFLVVVADLAGTASLCGGHEDYLIPSSILNAVVSGLVSRSVLNDEYCQPDGFHGCVFYEHLRRHDLSQWFVESILSLKVDVSIDAAGGESEVRKRQFKRARETVLRFGEMLECTDLNRIKPGIGEATRALLRRVPDRLFIRDIDSPLVAHLVHLAAEKGVRIDIKNTSPYEAITYIKPLGKNRHGSLSI